MADAIVSNVLQLLVTTVQKEVAQEVRLVVDVEEDVNKLTHTFTEIREVLKDAEENQIMDDRVRRWLQDLKDVAYDIDDVLDEWTTEILKSQIDDHGVHDEHAHKGQAMMVCFINLISPCLFCFKGMNLRHDIARRIKEINGRLVQISSEKDKFGFIRNETRRNEIIEESRTRLETSSLVDSREVFGRNTDRDIIISKLLSKGSSSQQEEVVLPGVIPVIAIVGMPGLGKTTLAQHIFNDDRVKNHFIERIWVHVSKPFDKVKVAMRIIEKIGGNTVTQEHSGHQIAWETVHHRLTSSINGKQFLLVLDDVWNEEFVLWDPLRLSLQCGSQGSKILVTTRNEKVAIVMGTGYVHRLRVLSDPDCWSLLSRYAFVGRQNEERKTFEEIGMELANKCDGLPLSAQTLGSLLRFKKSKQDWQHVLESNVWRVVSSVNKQILPALLLSYNELPSHLKQCFAYCSLFSRGHTLTNFTLVRDWIAQGFLSDSLVANNEDLIAVGEEYLNNLVLRSLLQKDVGISSREFQQYSMHDLVHDFAKSLVEKECLTLTIKDNNAQEFNLGRARHLHLVIEDEKSAIPSFIYKANNVRTLRLYGQIPLVSSELFHHLKCLRTLDLSFICLEELPNEIEKLIHLRWLDLSEARFRELPTTLTNLYNLKMLDLYKCVNLCKLPEGIERLVNLIDLRFSQCSQISYLPEGIGKLTKLRGLSNFIISGVEKGGCKIGELKDLNFLSGTLRIIGLSRLENGNEIKLACLKNKQHLRALFLDFNEYTGVSIVDEEVNHGEGEEEEEEEAEEEEEEEDQGEEEEEEAEAEEEEEKEEEEEAEAEKEEEEGEEAETEEEEEKEEEEEEAEAEKEEEEGEEAEEEAEEEEEEKEAEEEKEKEARRMEEVLECLQPHPNLEKLVITDYIGAVFPSWMVNHADFISFSNLVFLQLDGWKKCKQLPSTLGKLPSLETLVVQDMHMVKFMSVDFFTIASGTRSAGGVDTIFPKLKVFMLSWMLNLKDWDMQVQEEDVKEFVFMPCLQYLVLHNLPKLRSFPQHLTQNASLRKLFIWDCPKLTWMPSPSTHLPFLPIEELILKDDAGSLSKSLVANNHNFLPKLKLLRVRQSPYSWLPKGLGQLTSLEILDIRTCSEIKSIREGELQHLTALKELRIMRCPALRRSCQKEIGEDWRKISHISNIFVDGEKIK